jgi:hypothetical protein
MRGGWLWGPPHTGVAVAALATLVLTTYSPGSRGAEGELAARDDAQAPTEATVPTIEDLPTAELELDQLAPPEPPAHAADVGTVTPFRGSATPGVGEDERVAADLVLRAPEARPLELEGLSEPLSAARHAAAGAELTATLAAAEADNADTDGHEVEVLGVEAGTFRPLTPEITADSDPLWDRFAEGDVLVSHELAEELDLELGGRVLLHAGETSVSVRIGAFAVNGDPPFADVLVPTEVTAELGASGPNLLVVSAVEDVEELGDTLAEATGGDVEIRRPLAAPVAGERTTEDTPSGAIEPFSYTSRADGRITIHGDWVDRNIVRIELPGMASSRCQRVMVPQLYAAVEELIERGLYGHLDPAQFAGCFVARHIDWDPGRPLSMHAWGLAIDLNARDNPLGATPVMDRQVVEVFERWGFDWGGHWPRPDGMHFELARIVPTG